MLTFLLRNGKVFVQPSQLPGFTFSREGGISPHQVREMFTICRKALVLAILLSCKLLFLPSTLFPLNSEIYFFTWTRKFNHTDGQLQSYQFPSAEVKQKLIRFQQLH